MVLLRAILAKNITPSLKKPRSFKSSGKKIYQILWPFLTFLTAALGGFKDFKNNQLGD
jgi:hypothetical protein